MNRSLGSVAFNSSLVLIYGFLLAGPVVTILYSFSPSIILRFPPSGFTLRWYESFLAQPRLLSGLVNSLVIGVVAAISALAIGVPAAYGLVRSNLPGRGALAGFFLLPLSLPGLVLALGILMLVVSVVQPLTGARLAGQLPPLLAAHLIITIPWVIRTVTASLESSDRAMEEAGRGLGAGPIATFFLVTLPLIRPGIVAAAVFAFIVSFGNFALSLFFASASVTTLPVAMFEYLDRFQDPTVAAASTVVIVFTVAVVFVADRSANLATGTKRHRS
jgi:putative spermidine/putrescine transport system permease protein